MYNTKDVIGFTRTYRCLTVIYTSNSHVGGVGLMRSWNTMQNNLEESFV